MVHRFFVLSLGLLLTYGTQALASESSKTHDDIRAFHQSLMTLDTHLDTPVHFSRPGWSIMDRHSYDQDLSQVDYPRMLEGGLDGGFFVIYTEQGPLTAEGFAQARNHALIRAVEIREMVAKNSKYFGLATTPADASRLMQEGKIFVFQSIENSYPLGKDLTLLKTFYDLGVRMVGPVHFRNNQFGDSSTDPDGKTWNGLSPLGKDLVKEANRRGMVLDASHASDDVLDQMISLSKTPIILSHSGCRALFDHPRNVDDARIKKLAASGGVIQIYAVAPYFKKIAEIPEQEAIWDNFEQLPANQAGDKMRALRAREKELHLQPATFDDFMAHLLHALKLVGPEHVGIGADWDGGGGVDGFNDIASLPKVTVRLKQAGYTDHDIALVMGGNVLRILKQAEDYAASVKK